jgi:glycosyltransferase involved in cell wall biosynthesis
VLARPAAPIVYTAHGLSYRRTGDPVGRLIRFGTEAVLCHRAAAVITVSSMDLRDLRRRRVLRASKGVHIGNGIRLERFAGGDRRAARMRLGIDEDAFVVGSVTRLVPEKAVADLVDAVLELPSAVLVVVGEGPLQRDLVARARPAGGRIRFVGSRDDVPDILPAFDVFALSSLWEGEPIALLEAMAAGLPCVATRTSGARELLEGGQLGILTKVGQPSEMASVIETLRLDPDERERLAQAARVSVGGRSWASVAARVADVYTSVLADDHGPSKVDG